jgi:hypothetical protein
MQYGVSLLHGIEEYRDSVAHLERLKDRLEGAMRPLLLHAFANRNARTRLLCDVIKMYIRHGGKRGNM